MLISSLLLGLGGLAIGWLLAWNAPPGDRQVEALGTGMRNFSAALLIAGRDFDAETLVMTSAGAFMLMAIMLIIAGEIGRATSPAQAAGHSPPSQPLIPPDSRCHAICKHGPRPEARPDRRCRCSTGSPSRYSGFHPAGSNAR